MLDCLFKKGRHPVRRGREKVTCMVEADLMGRLRAIAGKNGSDNTEIINTCLMVALPVIEAHPEFIDTFKSKFNDTVKK